jgi:hypothetical protein
LILENASLAAPAAQALVLLLRERVLQQYFADRFSFGRRLRCV